LKIVFDTNVVLDVLLDREPYSQTAINLFAAVENKVVEGCLCATTITTVDYLCTIAIGRKPARLAIGRLLELFRCAEVNEVVLKAALASDFSDFEDAVLYHAGIYANADGIVTRNINDFAAADRAIYTPAELWSIIQLNE